MPSDECVNDDQHAIQTPPVDLDALKQELFGQLPDLATDSACSFFEYRVTTLKLFASGLLELNALTKVADSFKEAMTTLVSVVGPAQMVSTPPGTLGELAQIWINQVDENISALDAFSESLVSARIEVALCRSVEAYLVYISNILVEIYKSNPSMLKSSEQVTFEDVLKHGSLDEFIDWAVERRVSALSFKGFVEISKYVEQRLALALVTNRDMERSIIRAIAIRNLLVHKRGVVDEAFLQATGDSKSERGKQYAITGEDVEGALISINQSVCDIDKRARAKFTLSALKVLPEEWWKPLTINKFP